MVQRLVTTKTYPMLDVHIPVLAHVVLHPQYRGTDKHLLPILTPAAHRFEQ